MGWNKKCKPQIDRVTFHYYAESRLQRKREKEAISVRKDIMAIDPMADGATRWSVINEQNY